MVLRLFGLKKKDKTAPADPETTTGQGQPPLEFEDVGTTASETAVAMTDADAPRAAKATRRKGTPSKAGGARKSSGSKSKAKKATRKTPAKKTNQRKR